MRCEDISRSQAFGKMDSAMWLAVLLCFTISQTNSWPQENFRPRMDRDEVVDVTGQLTRIYKTFMVKLSVTNRMYLGVYLRGYRHQVLLKFGNSRWVYTDPDTIAPGRAFRMIFRQKINILKFYILAVEERRVVFERSYPLIVTSVSMVGPVQNGRITKSQWTNYVPLPTDCGRRLVAINPPAGSCERIYDPFQTRTVNGTPARAGDHPWQVSIWESEFGLRGEILWRHVCGGTLIDECWVLSAAHCFPQPWAVIRMRVRAGDYYNWNDRYNEFSSYENSQELFVKKIIIHEQFFSRSFALNDIALVQLRANPDGRCVRYGRFVQPACLPSGEDRLASGTECVISGWGARRHGRKLIEDQPCLQNGRVGLISNQQCKDQYPDILPRYFGQPQLEVIPTTVQCTEVASGDMADACRGDSGGPLVCPSDDRLVLWGIASKGKRCNAFYGVYTRMTSFVDFVDRHLLQENKFDPNAKDA